MDEDLWAAVRAYVRTDVLEKAKPVLVGQNMTVNDAITILLERLAKHGEMPFPLTPEEEHDCWVRARVQEALDDPRPPVPNEEVKAYFAAKRAALVALEQHR